MGVDPQKVILSLFFRIPKMGDKFDLKMLADTLALHWLDAWRAMHYQRDHNYNDLPERAKAK